MRRLLPASLLLVAGLWPLAARAQLPPGAPVGAEDAGAPLDASAPEPTADAGSSEDASAPEPSAGDAGSTAEAGARLEAPLVVLVDTAPIGVDPAAATFVTEALRQTLVELGYRVVPTPQLYDLARRVQLPFPPPPDALASVLTELHAALAVTVELRGAGGYYYPTLRVRLATEPVERVRQLLCTQWTLGDSLRLTLPQMVLPGNNGGDPTGGYPLPTPQLPPLTAQPYRPLPPSRIHPRPFEVALGLEFALGPGQDSFWNFLGYARFAWFPFDRFGITGSVAYANLRGRNGRVSNVLPMLGMETAVDLMPDGRLYLPLRGEVGYLPYNGVVLRLTAGLGFTVAGPVRIELDLLSPTFWFLPGTTAISLDLGAQVLVSFGGGSNNANNAGSNANGSNGNATEGSGSATPRRRRRRRTAPPDAAASPGNSAQPAAPQPVSPQPAPAQPAPAP